ncbi:MAG: hypothetical protein ACO4CT_13595, partial [Planctomycetota bacterium]
MELEIEVYDPFTGGVWEGVGVRVVQADQEWSGCVCVSPYANDFALTDRTGLAYFSPFALAAAEVGFVEDAAGRAVLYSGAFENDQITEPGLEILRDEIALFRNAVRRLVFAPETQKIGHLRVMDRLRGDVRVDAVDFAAICRLVAHAALP